MANGESLQLILSRPTHPNVSEISKTQTDAAD